MSFFKNRRIFLIILFILIFDILFFSPLFFPEQKLIITPEFGGGDSIVIQLPWKKLLAGKIKNFELPLWSKNMGFGWPLFAESEVGALNPVNIITSYFWDYKTAFNLQIFLHSFISQIGLLLLAFQIGMSLYGALFLALLFPFTPFLLMNYMHISLVYPFLFVPYILFGLIRFLKKQNFPNFIILSISIFFQLLANHPQIFFITSVFMYLFVISYYFFDLKKPKIKKILVKSLFFLTLSYLLSLLLGAIQFFPMLEYLFSSDRSSQVFGSFALQYDQNFGLNNLLTIISPYIFGRPQDGTYPMGKIADPWEGTIFIYYVPLMFLIFFIINYSKLKSKITNSLIICFFIILLIALGNNSPFYLIHNFPPFSFFRFPSRFNFVIVFILTILASIGLDYLFKKVKFKLKKIIYFILISILFIEAYLFNYDFHVLLDSKKIFIPNKIAEKVKKNKYRLYSPTYERLIISKEYNNYGYKNDELYYYNFLNCMIIPNINLIYDIPSLSVRIGPHVARFPIIYKLILSSQSESKEKNNSIYPKINKYSVNLFKLLGISHIITSHKFEDKNLLLEQKEYCDKQNIVYLYEFKNSSQRIQLYPKVKYISSLEQFTNYLETKDLSQTALIEDRIISNKMQDVSSSINYNYKIDKDEDMDIKITINSNSKGFLVLKDTYYPGWKAYINGEQTEIFRANFLFKGIYLPKGKNIVEFLYIPLSFYLGLYTSIVFISALLTIIILRIIINGKK